MIENETAMFEKPCILRAEFLGIAQFVSRSAVGLVDRGRPRCVDSHERSPPPAQPPSRAPDISNRSAPRPPNMTVLLGVQDLGS